MAVAREVESLPWLFLGTLTAMLAANPLFAALVSRVPRRTFIPVTYRFFTFNLLIFYLLLQDGIETSVNLAAAFFVWTSVFNLFVVSVFWGFMADVWTEGQGKRLFGFIGIGGTSGAILGALTTAALAEVLGPVPLLLVAAALLEVANLCFGRVVRIFGVDSGGAPAAARGEILSRGGSLGGLKEILRSRYLQAICLYLLFFTLSNTLIYFEQARVVDAAFGKDPAAKTAAFARIDLWENVVVAFLQIFATGRVIRALGIGATLCLLPAATLLGFSLYAAFPAFLMLVLFRISRRATELGLAKPAREVLYTVVDRETKYKAKSFIDTVVYRVGDALSAWASAGLLAWGLGFGALFLVVLPSTALWILASLYLGREQKALAAGS